MVTVQTLLDQPTLNLRLLTSHTTAAALANDVEWAHSSDLADPSPFLDSGHVLLTTGTQFEANDEHADAATARFASDYVARLVETGVVALGFGTEVTRAGTPESLIDACERVDLPLFDVPYRTPFIAIVRDVADALAHERHARQRWALQTQHALSLAALRPDGLSATLAELSRRLGAWVGLVDASGTLDREFPASGLAQPALGEVVGEARSMLRRAQRASRTLDAATSTSAPLRMTLQTLGAGGALRGVLAIGDSPELDQTGREVVTSVIALAGLALEQNHDLDRARSHLRSGLWRSLLAGDHKLAAGVAHEMWGPLPDGDVRVAMADVPSEHADRLTELLELRVDARSGHLFFGRDGDTMAIVVEAVDADLPELIANEFDVPVGISDLTTIARLPDAHEQALRALERSRESGPGVVAFDEISRQGVLAFLARTDARAVALATLAPLSAHDEANGTALVETTRVWLEHGGQFDRAAQVLGVHRHTVRNRVGVAEQLLGRDLSSFHARADLWAALLAVG